MTCFVEDGLTIYTIYAQAPEGNWFAVGRAVSHTPGGALSMARNDIRNHPLSGWAREATELRAIEAKLGSGINWEQPFPLPPGWEPGQ